MVGPGFTILLFCWLFSWSAGPSASEAQVVNPDLQGVLEELETSGVPPTAAELLEWGAQQNLPNTRDGMKASPWRGEILWRKGLYFPGGDEDLGRMELQRDYFWKIKEFSFKSV